MIRINDRALTWSRRCSCDESPRICRALSDCCRSLHPTATHSVRTFESAANHTPKHAATGQWLRAKKYFGAVATDIAIFQMHTRTAQLTCRHLTGRCSVTWRQISMKLISRWNDRYCKKRTTINCNIFSERNLIKYYKYNFVYIYFLLYAFLKKYFL